MAEAGATSPVALQVVASSVPAAREHLHSVLPRLIAHGLSVHVAIAEHLVEEYADLGVATTPLALSPRSRTTTDLAAASLLRRTIRAIGGVDLVHSHGFRSNALTSLALRAGRRGVGMVATWYDLALPVAGRGLSVRAAERVIARGADVTLATSSELLSRARQLGAPDARLAPIATGEVGSSVEERQSLRAGYAAELGLDPEVPWILVAGRVVPERSGQLLTVADRWNGLYPSPEVLAVGEGPPGVVAALQSAVAARGLPVRLLGARDDVTTLMRASDVFVLTSRWESRPIAVQQAMRVGLPVVANKLAGIAELVADTGVLVDADDVEALAAEVAALLADPERARRLARRAARRAGSFPTEDEVADTLAAVYAEVRARRPAA